VTSRFLSDLNGAERASLTVGQINYFANRRVNLCYRKELGCVDSPLLLGYVSPFSKTSPIASRGSYRINSVLSLTGDYVYDPATRSTDNDNVNLHYQPEPDRLVSVGYSYLVNGNLLPSASGGIQNTALHQATFAYAAPFTDRWSTLGVYSYNISKGYSMLGLFGVQYDNCCWAARLMGGRTFMSLSPERFQPQYNTNVYLQVLLKGLGTIENSDPSSIVRSYLPGLQGLF
jgi:LPS-assembly protein